MASPWEQYSDEIPTSTEGPWSKYGAETDAPVVLPELPQANALPVPDTFNPSALGLATLPPLPLGYTGTPIQSAAGTISLPEARHQMFQELKPSPRTVQNAFDVIDAYSGGAVSEPGVEPFTPPQIQEQLALPDQPISREAKVTSGLVGGGLNLAETFSTPEGVALMFSGGIPGAIGKLVNAGFFADMIRQAPQVYQNLGAAFGSGDTAKITEALVDAVAHGLFTIGTGHGTIPDRLTIRRAVEQMSPEQRAAIETQVKSQTPGEPNASNQPQASQVHATLPASAEPRVQEVPAKEGGERIQQPPQPTEAPQAEVPLTLKPAIQAQGQIIEGKAGKTHGDIVSDTLASGDSVKTMAAIAGRSQGSGFVGPDGNFRTRKEARSQLEEQYGAFELMNPDMGLNSEDLGADGKPRLLYPEKTITDPQYTEQAKLYATEAMLKKVQDITPEAFRKLNQDYKKQTDGSGLTQLSYDIGDVIAKSGRYDLVDAFREAYQKANAKNNELAATVMDKLSKMSPGPEADAVYKPVEDMSSQPQFFNEVVQRAEWIRSGGVEKPGTERFKKEKLPEWAKPAEALPTRKVPVPVEATRLLIDPFGVGAARIVAKAAAVPVKSAIVKANRTRKAFGTLFRATANRKVMDQTFDAAENMANIAGQQARKSLDIGTTPIEREAALAVIEANGDPTKLVQFEQQAIAGGNKNAQRAVAYARNNWQGLQDLAARMKGVMDVQVADENANGISTEYHEAYVPHLYDKDLWMGAGRPFVIGAGGGGGASTGFKKGRTFPTIFDAIEAGYVPESLDAGKLAEHRVKNGQKLINRKQWGESLASVHDPTDNKPLATAMVRKARGPGQPGYEAAPVGYVPREIIPGVRVAIHEGYSSLFDAMTGTSRISGNAAGQMLLQAEGAVKHGLLLFDTFHASRIMQKQLLLTGKFDAGARGHTLLEYADHDLSRAVAANLITPEMASWVRQNRPTANLLIRNGLNVGRVSEALYTSFIREIPVLGTFNKWVFEKLTRGAMLQAGLIEFERISKAMPDLTPKQVALKVSRDLNAYFGNLGRQGLFKSATAQDLARLTFLAPNWVESMARTEIKGAMQAAKGLTIDPFLHKTILTGSIGKGVAQGLLAYFIGTQLLNLVTRGHPTWQNPEDKHKLDAWIPDLSGKGGHGFFISPFSVVAELTHDMLRYTRTEGTALKAAAKILVNKLSPPGRALKVLLSGKDFDKTQIDSTWGRVKAAATALAPTPIPLSPLIKGTQYPGQTQRQLTASLGFKTEPAESATQQIADKATEFLKKQGKARAYTFEPTEDPSYAKLRTILRRGDEAAAVKMLNELQAQHTGKQVLAAMRNHARHPFTGSKTAERTFLNTLSDKDAALYGKAKDEQKAEYDNFLKLWYSGTGARGAPAATNAPAATAAPWLNY